jgi:hypothetical protein
MFTRFTRWLKRLSTPAPAPSSRPRRRPPQLEILEERTLLNSRFVVPIGVAPDNHTAFATLRAALTTSGLAAGDVIQIEPGSAPGGLKNADLPALASLTIQGDPAVAASELPAFTVEDAVAIASSQAGFTLKNVNVVLQGGGLDFQANFTLANSLVTDNFTGGDGIKLDNTTAGVVRNSTIVNGNTANDHSLIHVIDAGNNHNLISGDNIASYSTGVQDVVYIEVNGSVTDQIVNNRLVDNEVGGSSFGANMIFTSGVGGGLSIQGNFIQTNDYRRGLLLESPLTLSGNTFKTKHFGVDVFNGGAGTTMTLTIAGNQIDTGGAGTGIDVLLNTGVLSLKIEGNDLHNNQIGVSIDNTNGNTDLTGIDLGGGSLGSRGANNFRDFTAAATSAGGAVVVSHTKASQGAIKARNNLFGVANPETVVWDIADDSAQTDVDVAFPRTGNAAYVEALYLQFLHRIGDTSSPSDAGGWVTLLNNGAPASVVAAAIVRSPEALGFVVDGLYHQFLNRDSDAGGRASLINYLQNGGTLEAASIGFLASPEYRLRFGSDGAFVQSLYVSLLGRVGGASEVAGWVSLLPSLGRAGVAGDILASAEHRGDVARAYYAQLLHRAKAPSDQEVNSWVGSNLDLLSIETQFAASGEFQSNG